MEVIKINCFEELFVSRESKSKHLEYLRSLNLKYSIFEKSYPEISEKSFREIKRMRIRREEIEELIMLKAEISAHELFFSSFGKMYQRCTRIKKQYGSEANFLYELRMSADKAKSGFLLIYENDGKIQYYSGENYHGIIITAAPKLAIDLCEHAYFIDYGFERDRYVNSALKYLNISSFE